MNAIQIRKMLNNNDSVIELLMQIYYQTEVIDWEEIKWLFITYLQKGILDFPTATQMAIKRISAYIVRRADQRKRSALL